MLEPKEETQSQTILVSEESKGNSRGSSNSNNAGERSTIWEFESLENYTARGMAVGEWKGLVEQLDGGLNSMRTQWVGMEIQKELLEGLLEILLKYRL